MQIKSCYKGATLPLDLSIKAGVKSKIIEDDDLDDLLDRDDMNVLDVDDVAGAFICFIPFCTNFDEAKSV